MGQEEIFAAARLGITEVSTHATEHAPYIHPREQAPSVAMHVRVVVVVVVVGDSRKSREETFEHTRRSSALRK